MSITEEEANAQSARHLGVAGLMLAGTAGPVAAHHKEDHSGGPPAHVVKAQAERLCERNNGGFIDLGALAYVCLLPTEANEREIRQAERLCERQDGVLFVAVGNVAYACVLPGGAGSRLLPNPTQQVVARIVRAVTPFEVPEHRQSEAVSSGAKSSETTPVLDHADRVAGDHAQPGTGHSERNRGRAVGPGGGAESRSQREGAQPRLTPGTTLVPGAPRAQPPPPVRYVFSADLRGATGTQTTGDPDGHGSAVLETTPGINQLCLSVDASGIDLITAAHLHAGSLGTSGPVVATFAGAPTGTPASCVTVADELVTEIRTTPANYYVDVHTTEFPDEALRGHLT